MFRLSPSNIQAFFGTATLVGGTVAGISPNCLTDPDKCTILLSRNTVGGTLGFLSAPVANRGAAATTFTITSSNGADTSTVNWLAIPKNVGNASSTTFVNNASLRRGPSGLNIQKGFTTLVAGTKTVTAVPFGAQAIVFVLARLFHGTPGKLSVPTATVNSTTGQFVINSNSGTDTSDVQWLVVDQPLRFSPSGNQFSQSKGSLSGTTEFTGMNPFDRTTDVIIASVITAGANNDNLSGATAGNGTITVSPGAIEILSNDSANASLIEVASF